MLRFNCPHCGKAIKAGDEAAGKKGKCPGCGDTIHLPQIAALSDDDVLAVLGVGPGSPVEKSLTPPIAIADDWLTVRHKPRPPDAAPPVANTSRGHRIREQERLDKLRKQAMEAHALGVILTHLGLAGLILGILILTFGSSIRIVLVWLLHHG